MTFLTGSGSLCPPMASLGGRFPRSGRPRLHPGLLDLATSSLIYDMCFSEAVQKYGYMVGVGPTGSGSGWGGGPPGWLHTYSTPPLSRFLSSRPLTPVTLLAVSQAFRNNPAPHKQENQ